MKTTSKKGIKKKTAKLAISWESVIEHLPAIIFIKDSQTFRYQMINKAAAEFIGLDRDQILGRTDFELYPQNQADFYNQVDRQVLRENKAIDIPAEEVETRVLGKRWLHTKKVPIVSKEGSTPYVLGIAEDITDQKKMAEEVHNRNEIFRQIAEHVEYVFWVTNAKTLQVEYVNPAYERLWGRKIEDLYIDPDAWMKSIHSDDRARVQAAFRQLPQSGIFDEHYRTQRPNGEMSWMHDRGFPCKNLDGKTDRYVGICVDETEIRTALAKEKDFVERLKVSNAELEQFAYAASHDLQEPLRVISNFSTVLKEEYPLGKSIDQNAVDYIDFMIQAVQQQQQLITSILSLSRLSTEAKAFGSCDLNHVLERVKSNLKIPLQEKRVSIKSDRLPTVHGDSEQLVRLFQNFISNSIKFCLPETIPQITIEYSEIESHFQFCVKDNGIGFDEHYRESIFEMFEKLHSPETYSGVGMGLAICRKIVARHGGKIWARSQKGKGSSFYFTLPQLV